MDNTKEFEDFDIEINDVSQSNTEEILEEIPIETVHLEQSTDYENTVDSEAIVDPKTVEDSEHQSMESVNQSDLINTLFERIEKLSHQNELLHNKFDAKIAEDEHKAQLFDKMYDELASYKKNLYAKLVGPFINETISLLDDYERFIEKVDSIDMEKLVKYVKGIPEDLESLLDNNGVERYSDDTEKFNPKTQRVIKTILTSDRALDNIIAERTRKGYRWNGVMLKPEMVKIFKFKEGYVELVKSNQKGENQSEIVPSVQESVVVTTTQE